MNFPIFHSINELKLALQQDLYSDLNQIGEDGQTFFAQIVAQIHNISQGDQKSEGQLLGQFASAAIENGFSFSANNQPDTQGFTPLGHLLKNFHYGHPASNHIKHIFRAIIEKDQQVDWYQNTKLSTVHDNTGPALVKVLTSTHSGNVLKRISECIDAEIEIDFNLLSIQPNNGGGVITPFAQNLARMLNNNDLSITKFKQALTLLKDAKNIESLINFVLSHDTNNAEAVVDTMNQIDNFKIDVSKLNLQTVFTNLCSNLQNAVAIARPIKLFKLLQNLDNSQDGLDINNLFNVGAQGLNLVTHMLSSLKGDVKNNALEMLKMLTDENIKVDLNARGSGDMSSWHRFTIAIFKRNVPPTNFKEILKECMRLTIFPKEELASLFMRYMPIEDVINICVKQNFALDFNKAFKPLHTELLSGGGIIEQNNPLTDREIHKQQRDASLIEILFSFWSRPGNGIRDLSIIKKMQAIDQELNFTQAYKGLRVIDGKAQEEFSLIDCIETNGSVQEIIEVARTLEDKGIIPPMAECTAKKFAAASQYPSIFKQVKALKVFENADAKAKAVFVLHVRPDDFVQILSNMLQSNMEIDFSDSMAKLVHLIEGEVKQTTPGTTQPPATVHHVYSLFTLTRIFEILSDQHITLGKNNLITDQILTGRDSTFMDVIELLNILATHEEKFPCDLQNIAHNVYMKHAGTSAPNAQKELILDTLMLFKNTQMDWGKFFASVSHTPGNEDADIALFVSKKVATEDELYKGMLLYSNSLASVIPYLNGKLGNIVHLKDENGNTGWHMVTKNPNLTANHLISCQFNVTNYEGENVFVTILDARDDHDSTSLIYHILAQQHIRQVLIEQNVDVNQVSPKGRVALNLIAKSYNILPSEIETLTNALGEPIFNVNQIDGDSKRAIDYVAEKFAKGAVKIETINLLRRCGSIEPLKTINRAKADKLDLSNEKLDTHEPNKMAVVKLVDLMYEKYPLTPSEIEASITNFKTNALKEIDADIAWGRNVNTIPQVIDAILLLGENGTITDRITDISSGVNAKKLIGTIIHIVEKHSTQIASHPADDTVTMRLGDLLIVTLRHLKMCDLGKLMNLMGVVQNVILADNERKNYADPAFQQIYDNLLDAVLTKAKKSFGEMLPKALTVFCSDLAIEGIRAQEWNASTQKMYGIFSTIFLESTTHNLDESYHFTDTLRKLKTFCAEMQQSHWNLEGAQYAEWNALTKIGVEQIAIDLCKNFKHAAHDDKPLKECFQSIETPKFAFGDFTTVGRGVFIHALQDIPQHKVAEFLCLLIDNCSFQDDVLVVLSERLIDQARSHPDELAAALNSCPSIVDMICTSAASLKHWYNFLAQHDVDKVWEYIYKLDIITMLDTPFIQSILYEARDELTTEALGDNDMA